MNEPKITKSVTTDAMTATVVIGGSLTIEMAAELRQVLGDALAEAHKVLLDVRQLDSLDITILQAICSACRTAADTKRSFLPEGELPLCIKELVNGIGARMETSCRHNNNDQCIWFGGA